MKQIKLTQGQFALVDDADFETLNQYKWFAQKTPWGFYAVRNSPKKNGKSSAIRMHRQILELEYGDKRQGDHRDHNTLNNCRTNLRICTQSQNNMNRELPSNTTSQFKGVSWQKLRKKWMAYITINGKMKNLGRFPLKKDAVLAYNKEAEKYFGEFACLNLI